MDRLTLHLMRLRRYWEEHLPPGSFLRSVLENNLIGTVATATREDLMSLPHLVAYVYEEAPPSSYGSRRAVKRWVEAVQ